MLLSGHCRLRIPCVSRVASLSSIVTVIKTHERCACMTIIQEHCMAQWDPYLQAKKRVHAGLKNLQQLTLSTLTRAAADHLECSACCLTRSKQCSDAEELL